MANDENQADEAAPWTIKGMKVSTRKQAIARSTQAGLSVAEYMARLIDRDAREGAADRIIPPMGRRDAPPSAFTDLAPIDLSHVAATLVAITQASEKSGLPVSKAAVRDATATFRAYTRQARGLPQLAHRKTEPASRANQTTIDGEKE